MSVENNSAPYSARDIVNIIQSHDASGGDVDTVRRMLSEDYLSLHSPSQFSNLVKDVEQVNKQELRRMAPIHSEYDDDNDAGQLSVARNKSGDVQNVDLKVSGLSSAYTESRGVANVFNADDPFEGLEYKSAHSAAGDLPIRLIPDSWYQTDDLRKQVEQDSLHKVQSGDSYWKIAQELNPDMNDYQVGQLAEKFKHLNGDKKIIYPDDMIPTKDTEELDHEYRVALRKQYNAAGNDLPGLY